MGGANSIVGSMVAYMVQGTAATKVSNIKVSNNGNQSDATGFESILNKASDTANQNRMTDVSKNVKQTSVNSKEVDGTKGTDVSKEASALKDTNVSKDTNTSKDVSAANEVQARDTDIKTDASMAENQMASDNAPVEIEEAEVTDIEAEVSLDLVDTTVETGTTVTDLKTTETDPRLQEAILEDTKEIMNAITEIFDLDEEDVVNAMQVLGLMAADLFSQANIQELVTQITDEEQAIDLITDSDIYTSLQDLMEGAESMKSELMNEFDLSEDQFRTVALEADQEVFGQLQEVTQEEPAKAINPVIENNVEVVSAKEDNLKETDKFNINLLKDAKGKAASQSEAFKETVPSEENKIEIVTTETSKHGSDNNRNFFQSGAESSNLFNQVMNNISEAAANVEGTMNTTYTDRAQMEDVIRQITEKITISAKAEETSMELQLHPASLGNVNILLTSGKDGIIAKFTAQNQIVKEAVEAQMVQLQQKFDEQGIKVTSIEVTLASHGFEQNLEQGNEKQNQSSSEEKRVKGLRRINLTQMSDAEEEMIEDAERIAVSMMAANGNSVDFSA